mgnify:CR=1 FL=1|tara:strand:- start:1796 stop:3088 length:1293 start_codon:yes stop_codon:yes gene_type:complete
MPELENYIELLFDKLWPLCRSITGEGLRNSFKILKEIIPLELTEVPTGTKVFDWEIPEEWIIEDAYIITPNGEKICDFKKNNLHVVNYSSPIDDTIEYHELVNNLHYLSNQPDAIPYITSYYSRNWGFCLSKNNFDRLSKKGKYRVVINSKFKNGSLTYGDLVLPGMTSKEILFTSYLCHPSMANNELSGPLCLAFLYQKIKSLNSRKYTYRFVIAPETIGTIAYLSNNGDHLKEHLLGGFVLTCCGDKGNFTYKMSKNETSIIDRTVRHVLKFENIPNRIIPFEVGGSDERQYCSPGFNFSVGSLMRTPYQKYREYHTSKDNKSFISFKSMKETICLYFKIVEALELNEIYVNSYPFCEPNLGKRNLYPNMIKSDDSKEELHNLLHLISFCDGESDLLSIAEKKEKSIFDFRSIVNKLQNNKIIKSNDL